MERLIENLKKLPDDEKNLPELMRLLWYYTIISIGEDDIENGRYCTLEEFKKEREELYEQSYNYNFSEAKYG